MNFAAPPGSQVKIMDKKGMMHELDNRQSRYVAHKKKERKGWKKSKHDMHMNQQKAHMQNRGSAHRLGDARYARGN